MRPTDILDKTEKGQEEIRTRRYKLAGKVRMLLMLVDGLHPAFILREQAEKLGLSADALDVLIADGFVGSRSSAGEPAPAVSEAVPVPPEAEDDRFARYTAARRLLTESTFSALGLKGFLFTLKIEKTANIDDLRRLIPEYERQMVKALGPEGASLFVRRLQELTGL